MKDRGIEFGIVTPKKNIIVKEVYELIYIANFFPELREKR